MCNRDAHPDRVQADARKLQEKFGECSDIYAEERSEAAEMAGDEASARHWGEVADKLEDGGE